jgi:membrane-associated PAP2 superfamily phosphatase
MNKLDMNKLTPIIIATVIIALITLAARLWDLDLTISGAFYSPDTGFSGKRSVVVSFFYDSIGLAVTTTLIFCLVYPVLYWRLPRVRHYWRTVLALFLCLAIGPGIIVNSIFKDNFGRPRPVQTVEFGGDHVHRQVLEANWGNRGKSFPSGHASVPLAFLVLAFSAYRRNQFRLAKGMTIGIVIWYLAVSYARIAAGGHHFTDVSWAGYIAFISAWLSYLYIEKPDK